MFFNVKRYVTPVALRVRGICIEEGGGSWVVDDGVVKDISSG